MLPKNLKQYKIALYGTGRFARKILSQAEEYQIVALVDQKNANEVYPFMDLPVLSIEEAGNVADIVVIGTGEMYWRVIYERICDCKLPVYLINGMQAKEYFKPFTKEKLSGISDSREESEIVSLIIERLNKIGFKEAFQVWQEWGYAIWGPVVWCFTEWLYRISEEKGVTRLFFLSRDGFLLKKAYDFLLAQTKKTFCSNTYYVITSRRLTYYAAIENEEDFWNYALYYYNGSIGDYLGERFGIVEKNLCSDAQIVLPRDGSIVRKVLAPYLAMLFANIKEQKKWYKAYLQSLNADVRCGVVDTGFTGQIAHSLRALMGIGYMPSFLFYGNKNKDNIHREQMETCFQEKNDSGAQHCSLRRFSFIVEAVFSAPCGTAVMMNESQFKYKPSVDFRKNELIYEGIKKFMEDAFQKNIAFDKYQMPLFIDKVFEYMMRYTRLSEDLQADIRWEDEWSGRQYEKRSA